MHSTCEGGGCYGGCLRKQTLDSPLHTCFPHLGISIYLELGKSLCQGFHCFKIQMVCGLIKYQKIGSAESTEREREEVEAGNLATKVVYDVRFKTKVPLSLIHLSWFVSVVGLIANCLFCELPHLTNYWLIIKNIRYTMAKFNNNL